MWVWVASLGFLNSDTKLSQHNDYRHYFFSLFPNFLFFFPQVCCFYFCLLPRKN